MAELIGINTTHAHGNTTPAALAMARRLVAAGYPAPDVGPVTTVSRSAAHDVATRLEAGHANNALPQTARSVVNCRMLPQDDPAEILATLRRVVGDSAVTVEPLDSAIPSPLVPEVFLPLERLTRAGRR